jgi:branched-chain amino acid transport system permease protein
MLSEYIRGYGEYHVLVFGLVALIVARFAPNGLVGLAVRLRGKAAEPAAPAAAKS